MAPTPIPVAILGVTGYSGEVALRILLGHPGFTVVHAGSDRLHGQRIADAVPAFAGETDLVMAPDTAQAISASRPGGRRESLERYTRRLEQLEELAVG